MILSLTLHAEKWDIHLQQNTVKCIYFWSEKEQSHLTIYSEKLSHLIGVCVCVCGVCVCVRVYVVYEDTNLYNDMGMTEVLQFEGVLRTLPMSP